MWSLIEGYKRGLAREIQAEKLERKLGIKKKGMRVRREEETKKFWAVFSGYKLFLPMVRNPADESLK